jgi:3-dehydroquinate synthase
MSTHDDRHIPPPAVGGLDLRLNAANAPAWTVSAVKHVSYEIRMRENVFDPAHPDLAQAAASDRSRRRFVAVDANVERLYGNRVRDYFAAHGIDPHYQVVQAGETRKTFDTVAELVRGIDAFGIDRRREPIIAIGGGVLLDVVGLTANLYRRGTPVVRLPTTLIGLVDAGVGVKTGINFNEQKNRLGTYNAADLTLLDPAFIATLSRRHVANGLAEVLKIALIKDAKLFAILEAEGGRLLQSRFRDASGTTTSAVGSEVIQRAIHGMLEELQPNLWEAKLERLVDYGHTFSPTIEMKALPSLLHGEAVCIDMALTTVLAEHRGLISGGDRDRVLGVMAELGLPVWHDVVTPEILIDALHDTVRHRDGRQRLPLPVGIGDAVFVDDVTLPELTEAVRVLAESDPLREMASA